MIGQQKIIIKKMLKFSRILCLLACMMEVTMHGDPKPQAGWRLRQLTRQWHLASAWCQGTQAFSPSHVSLKQVVASKWHLSDYFSWQPWHNMIRLPPDFPMLPNPIVVPKHIWAFPWRCMQLCIPGGLISRLHNPRWDHLLGFMQLIFLPTVGRKC